MYALVEATPISQPALMCTPQCVPRAMAEPTVFVIPMHSAPRALAYSSAYTSAPPSVWLPQNVVSLHHALLNSFEWMPAA